jgi:hypothetical protein
MTLTSGIRDVLGQYVTIALVVALQLDKDTGRPSGVITSLPQHAAVVVCGSSSFATGMIEVSWQGERYAVFERDFKARAVLECNGRPAND